MQLLGFGLDNLSLMALTVATGFVVDDAIVMIENVVRYIEQGMQPLEAAYRGAGQIGFTIVSLTVSLIAVFIPLLFMTGVVGRLFKRIRRHAVGFGDRVRRGVADADADDVRPPAAPGGRGTSGPRRARWRGRLQRAARRLSAQLWTGRCATRR